MSFGQKNKYKKYLPVTINDFPVRALLDSGNTLCSAISLDFYLSIGFTRSQIRPYTRTTVGTADKTNSLRILGVPPQRLKIRVGGILRNFPFNPVIIENLASAVNLSGPFMVELGLDQLHSEQCIQIMGKKVPLFASPSDTPQESHKGAVYVYRRAVIPPKSMSFFKLRCPKMEASLLPREDGILRASSLFPQKTGLVPWKNVALRPDKRGHLTVAAMNVTDKPITLRANMRFGSFHLIQDIQDQKSRDRINAILTPKSESKPPLSQTLSSKSKTILFKKLLDELSLDSSTILKTNPGIRLRLKQLLYKFLDIFALDNETGKTDLIEHHIETTTDRPIMCRTRPINPAYDESLKKQIADWLRLKVIEPSNSPWNFCLLPVPKKSGEIRWVVDFRRLNDVTIKDSFPLPLIQDNLHRLGNSSIFSTLDGCQAFHTIPIAQKDREKTAFSTPLGLFQFARLPFGLSNAPASYSRLVTKVLQSIPLSMAMPYLDDVLVHSCTPEDHLLHLERVLAAHKKAGLKLKPSKCFLFRESVDYLGHNISAAGIATCPQYLEVIKSWPFPDTKAKIRTFIGKASYYRRFVKDFSKIAAPLIDVQTSLPTEKSPVTPTPKLLEAFETLKKALLKAPILAYPDFSSNSSQFIVDTDWSGDTNTIGGVLSQKQNGLERVIAYGSRKLANSMKKYSPHKGELCAILFFLKYWKHFLQYKPFLLRTDHASLRYLKSMDPPTGMIARWLETLSNFQFQVQHRKGTLHSNADSLSRISHAPVLPPSFTRSPEIMASLGVESHDSRLAHAQRNDVTLKHLLAFLEAKASASQPYSVKQFLLDNIISPSLDLAIYFKLIPHITKTQQGVLLFTYPESQLTVPCLPERWWRKAITQAHDLNGHVGFDKSFLTLKHNVFFPDMRMLTMSHINDCVECQLKSHGPKPQRHTLRSLNTGFPFQKLCIDFVGPLPKTKHNNQYLFTILDTFTKWIEAFAVPDCTAKTALSILQTEIFSRFGFPHQIHADNATTFVGTEFSALAKEYNIHLSHTPKYHPASNAVERYHRDLNTMLRSYVLDQPTLWDTYVPQCLLAMRTSVHGTTGFSAFEMMFGRKPTLPLNLLAPLPPETFSSSSTYITNKRKHLQDMYSRVRSALKRAVIRQKRYHYTKKQKTFTVHDKVWLFSATKPRKYHCGWSGPWTIGSFVNDVVVTLLPDPLWQLPFSSLTVSIDRIKLHQHSSINLPPHNDHDLQGLSDFFLEGPFGTQDQSRPDSPHGPPPAPPPRPPSPRQQPPPNEQPAFPPGGHQHPPPEAENEAHFQAEDPEPQHQNAEEQNGAAPPPPEPQDAHDGAAAAAATPRPSPHASNSVSPVSSPEPTASPATGYSAAASAATTTADDNASSGSSSGFASVFLTSSPEHLSPTATPRGPPNSPSPHTGTSPTMAEPSTANACHASGTTYASDPFRGQHLRRSPVASSSTHGTTGASSHTTNTSLVPSQHWHHNADPRGSYGASGGSPGPTGSGWSYHHSRQTDARNAVTGHTPASRFFVFQDDQHGTNAAFSRNYQKSSNRPQHSHSATGISAPSTSPRTKRSAQPSPGASSRPVTRALAASRGGIHTRTRARTNTSGNSPAYVTSNPYARKYKTYGTKRTSGPVPASKPGQRLVSGSKNTSKTATHGGSANTGFSNRPGTTTVPKKKEGSQCQSGIPPVTHQNRRSDGATALVMDGRHVKSSKRSSDTGDKNGDSSTFAHGPALLSQGSAGFLSSKTSDTPSCPEKTPPGPQATQEKRKQQFRDTEWAQDTDQNSAQSQAGTNSSRTDTDNVSPSHSHRCSNTWQPPSRQQNPGNTIEKAEERALGSTEHRGRQADAASAGAASLSYSTSPSLQGGSRGAVSTPLINSPHSTLSLQSSPLSSQRQTSRPDGLSPSSSYHGYPLRGSYPLPTQGTSFPSVTQGGLDGVTTPARDQANIFSEKVPWTPEPSTPTSEPTGSTPTVTPTDLAHSQENDSPQSPPVSSSDNPSGHLDHTSSPK